VFEQITTPSLPMPLREEKWPHWLILTILAVVSLTFYWPKNVVYVHGVTCGKGKGETYSFFHVEPQGEKT
jgi:hypothetical protein